MQDPWTRRKALATAGSALAFGLAGCSKNPGNDPSPTPTASLTATRVPVGEGSAAAAPSCPDGYQPLTPGWVVEGPGPLGGFDLILDRESYDQGDELIAVLRNVTDERQSRGNEGKFDVQYQGPDGWHTIFGTPEGRSPGWTSEGIVHQPGGEFTWRLTLSQSELSEGEIEAYPWYHACQPIKPGEYRFVFWGITTEKEHEEDFETDYALGEPFTVNDN